MGVREEELHRELYWEGRKNHGQVEPLHQFSFPTSPLRVLTVLQVPKVWLDRGASLVCLDSVVREDSLACLAHR